MNGSSLKISQIFRSKSMGTVYRARERCGAPVEIRMAAMAELHKSGAKEPVSWSCAAAAARRNRKAVSSADSMIAQSGENGKEQFEGTAGTRLRNRGYPSRGIASARGRQAQGRTITPLEYPCSGTGWPPPNAAPRCARTPPGPRCCGPPGGCGRGSGR